MEEKLYFKPETSGRKKKEKKEKPEKKDRRFLKLFFFLLFLVFVILVIIWLLKGSKTVSGQYPENVKNEALSCESGILVYPKITSTESDKKNLKINVNFDNSGKMKSIALVYTLFYDSEEEVRRAEAFSHAELNLGLNEQGYSSSMFENKFARLSDRLIISLFSDLSTLNEYNASYFMIEDVKSADNLPSAIGEYAENYQKQGFTCVNSEN